MRQNYMYLGEASYCPDCETIYTGYHCCPVCAGVDGIPLIKLTAGLIGKHNRVCRVDAGVSGTLREARV